MLNIIIIHFLALMTPGPDVLYVISHSMHGQKTNALKAVAGICLGVIVWSLFAAFGLSFLFKNFPWLIKLISGLGVCYLLYLGYVIFKSRNDSFEVQKRKKSKIFLGGLLTNLSNPKAIIYFSSILSVYITTNTDLLANIKLLTIIWLETFIWFYALSVLFSNKKIVSYYYHYKKNIDIAISISFSLVALFLLVEVLK